MEIVKQFQSITPALTHALYSVGNHLGHQKSHNNGYRHQKLTKHLCRGHKGMAWGVSKRLEDRRSLLALRAVLGVACPQGVEGSGMAVPGKTLGSPWPAFAIRP
jgi:hypothetical protein